MQTYRTPGVYKQEIFLPLPSELLTGVPVFIGCTGNGGVNTPQLIQLWPQFEETFSTPLEKGYLAYAVRGFFANGGRLCYVVSLEGCFLENGTVTVGDWDTSLDAALAQIAPLDTIDLVCVPDLVLADREQMIRLQRQVLAHCTQAGDRFAIFDSHCNDGITEMVKRPRELRQAGASGANGALYYPWILVAGGPPATRGFVPPSGHVAGIFARTDERVGVHKSPANEQLAGVLDLRTKVTDAQQGELNPLGVNGLRAFPGRGIRVWGARTLSEDPAWTYISVRRLFLTVGRWIESMLTGIVLEPNDLGLWVRIERELNNYFSDLFQQGALQGSTEADAFFVRCNEETNPPEMQELGIVTTEIGLAPALPGEFIVVRIVHGASGVTISEPGRSE